MDFSESKFLNRIKKAGEMDPEEVEVEVQPAVMSDVLDSEILTSANTEEINENGIILDVPEASTDKKNEAVETEVRKDIEFYKSWQDGNSEIFRNKNWIKSINKIKSDISLSMSSAGYSRDEINTFFDEKVNPWAKLVIENRNENRKSGNASINWESLSSQILEAVKEKLAGREPDPDVFRKNYENKADSNFLSDEDDGDILEQVIPANIGNEEILNVSMAGPEVYDSQILNQELTEDNIETSAVEAGVELAEITRAFENEKTTHEELVDVVSKDVSTFLQHLNIYNLARAQTALKSVESLSVSPELTEDKRIEKIRNALVVLSDINNRIRESIETSSEQLPPIPAPAQVAESVSQPAKETTGEASYLDLVKDDPLMNQNIEASYLDLVKDDPLMEPQVKAQGTTNPTEVTPAAEPAVELPQVEASVVTNPEASTVVPETAEYTQEEKDYMDYVRKRSALREVDKSINPANERIKKIEYRDAKDVYEKAEKEHLQSLADRSRWSVLKDNTAKMLGLKPEVPPELQVLEQRYKELRKEYAVRVHGALRARAKFRKNESGIIDETESLEKSDSLNIALANKLVLKPRAERLKQQEEYLLSEDKKALLNRVLPFLAKNKHLIRAGSVATASVLGALSGGAGAALTYGAFKAGKIVAGAVIGTYAAKGVKELTQIGVNKAQENIQDKLDKVTEDFNPETIDELEDAVHIAEQEKKKRVRTQKILTTAAAVSGGFAAGAYDHDSVASSLSERITNPEGVSIPSFNEMDPANAGIGDVMDNKIDPINDRLTDEASASSVESAPDYTVKSGDNLSQIMKSEYADTLKGLTPSEQDRVIGTLMERARIDTELRDSIGLNPRADGNIDKVWEGDKLNLDTLGDELKKIVENTDRVSNQAVATEGITEQLNPFENQIKMAQEMPWKPISPAEFATADANSINNYDASVEGPRPYTADGNYFNTEIYKEYTLGHFGSEEQLNKYLDGAVIKVEGPQTIGEIFEGKPRVFDTIKDLSMKQLDIMIKTPGAVEQYAITNAVDENKLREWLFNYDVLKKADLPYTDTTKFSDLFSRSEVESYVKNVYKNLEK